MTGKRFNRTGMAALSALALLIGAGAATGASWDERVFSSHVDFNAVAAAGASALSGLIARGKALFKAKFTTEDGAGRPKATQAIVPTKRKFGVNPAFSRTSGPDSDSCFGCHNDPIGGAAATSSPTCSSPRASKALSSTRPTHRSRASATRSR